MQQLDPSLPHDRPGILFLLSSLIIGGSERKVVRLVNVLKARGWDVRLAFLDAPDRTPAPLLAELHPSIPRLCLGRRGRYSPQAAAMLGRYLRDNAVGTVLAVNLHPLAYLVPQPRTLRRLGIRSIALLNGTEPRSRRDAAFMLLYRSLLRRVDQLVFGCRYQLDVWTRAYGLRRDRATYIYNGVDLVRFDPRSVVADADVRGLAEREHAIVIGSVGQLRREKNQRELLLAVAALLRRGHRIKLLLVGQGPEQGALRALARQLGIDDRIAWLGQVEDVRSLVAAMDVFVLSSASETFSNAALEAMALSRAVVLSRVGGAAEMISDGETGVLYPAGNSDLLAEALERLIAEPELRRRLGANARAAVEQRFGLQCMVREYEQLLGGVTPSARAEPRPALASYHPGAHGRRGTAP